MLKLNNKGFAITGILYTLLVLFLLILVFILAGLSSKRTLLMKTLNTFEEKYAGNEKIICETEESGKCGRAVKNYQTLVAGKYIFKSSDGTITCSAYLKEGVNIQNTSEITYTTKDCGEYNLNHKLVEVYIFERE